MENKEKVDQLKQLGNDALAAGDFDQAVTQYSLAIEADPTNRVLWSNRSAAYAKAGKWELALEDAESTLKLDDKWSRGYSRKAAALHGLGRINEAIETYKNGLEVDPNNVSLKQALDEIESSNKPSDSKFDPMALFGQFARYFQGNAIDRMKAIPEMSPYVNDPAFLAKVKEIQGNPGAMMQHIQDKGIMTYMSHILRDQFGSSGDQDKFSPMDDMHNDAPYDSFSSMPSSQPKPTSTKSKPHPPPPELTEEEKKALEFKEKGNRAYSNREFDEALSLYDKALEIQPSNFNVVLNRTAIFYERGDYDVCIESCERAIEQGRSLHVDFKLIARALGRIGHCYVKKDNLEQAIEYYKRSLTEHRSADILNALRDLERKKEEMDRLNYINPELSQKTKEEGNEHFKVGRYPEAIRCYTEAIKRDPSNPLLLTNRAAAYAKLGEYPLVIKDCDAALQIQPDLTKAFIRKGQTYHAMQEYTNAMETYDRGLKIDPNNAELRRLLNHTIMTIQSATPSDDDPQKIAAKAMQNPEVREILEDPVMQQILQQMSTDPHAASEHLRNPEIARRINILRVHGIVR